MSAAVTLCLVILLFVALHVAAWKLTVDRRRTVQTAVALLLTMLCLPGAWFAFYYLHILPEPPLLYQLRSLPFGEGFLAFFGAAAGAWRNVLPGLLKLLPTSGGMCLLAIPFLKPIVHPIDLAGLHERWDGDVCYQSSGVTCGPASAANILRFLGDTGATEKDLAREAWSSQSSTEAWHLARALRERGYHVKFLAPDGLPSREHLPGILGTGTKMAGHFIAVLEITDEEIHYIDPLRGRVRIPLDEFEEWVEMEPFFMSVQRGG
ncbi:cysteine peptidase family C39 domain-containing protein [Luteolibacter flavescens]|uniref:Cysteine peptidase family C39 domain-containing protein n=1 Tax=Luteolibacter flavescens TaxID=1859460 RepID=A0ABT3FIL7_9BACT|nr:cysteine peptidase family C39 domain-containing protein [Luteolibacter flavescens]MCW1883406.1 cysteine peptidase family C39 domain-containing protein [Luteolibacter flavescens]